MVYEVWGLPKTHDSTASWLYQQDPKEYRALHMEPVWLPMLTDIHFLGPYSGFSVWIHFCSRFLCLDMAARQLRFKIRVFLPLVGLPSWADKLHLPEVAGYEAQVVHLSILLRLWAGLCSKPEKYSVPNENIFAFLAFVGLLLWVCCLKILLLKR